MPRRKTYIDRKKSDNSQIHLDDKLQENRLLRSILRDNLKITDKDIDSFIKDRKKILLPISVFSNKFSTLEIVVKYLKDSQNFSLTDIAVKLNRDVKTIWAAYDRCKKKSITLDTSDSSIEIPLKIFSDRRFSMLESLVNHLHVQEGMRFSDISLWLHLDQATVWTVNSRYRIKNG